MATDVTITSTGASERTALGLPTVRPADEVHMDTGFAAPEHRTTGAGLSGIDVASDVVRAERLQAMVDGTLGSVHSWELVTAVDGPGTRLTFFLSGCPLRCLYCHNPDTMEQRRGQPVWVDEVLSRLTRYRAVFRATGGGLTLSGGEPLQQPKFVARILAGAKALGIHTTLDTSGYLGAQCTDEMLDNLDLVLLDIKSGIPETYKKVTGRELEPTLAFAKRLEAKGVEVWVRFVLVPGLTDAPENVEAVADYAAGISTVSRVEVLPFHNMGRDKWASLGMKYELENTPAPTAEQVAEVRARFEARGLTVY